MAGLLLLLLLLAPPAFGQTACDYTAADAHALAAPESAAGSVASLSRYLMHNARNDREKTRAIYRWITESINYDASLLGKDVDPEVVLKQRRAVCAGYASLFAALAEASGLTAVVVHGEAKGVGPKGAMTSEGLLTHDWNAVQIDDAWRLVDCTWGAGRLDERLRFVPRFTDHYFLTPPELFVYDHLPKEARWQLLELPLSRSDFLKRVTVKSAFFENGLQLVSHPHAQIECDGSLTVTVGAPAETIVAASLARNGRDLDGAQAFAQREGDNFAVSASMPSKGIYVLRIFARKRDSQSEEYDLAAEYRVEAGAGNPGVFPKMFVSFQERDCHLDRPLSGRLRAGSSEHFSLRAPGAEDVVVEVSGVVQHLAAAGGDAFTGAVNLEPGAATVFARFPGNRRYEGLLKYVVE
jgi:hypothetical protein